MFKKYNQKEINDYLAKHPTPPELIKATNDLLDLFPEFKNSKFNLWNDNPIPFMVFSDFNRFLIDRLKDNSDITPDLLIKRAADFISKLYSSGNYYLKDLVLSGVFEDLVEDPNTKVLINLMSVEAGNTFKEFFK